MPPENSAFREVPAPEAIGIFVGASLRWALRVAEIDMHASINLEARMLRHFRTLIPCERTANFFGQGHDGRDDRIAYWVAPCPVGAGPFLTLGPTP